MPKNRGRNVYCKTGVVFKCTGEGCARTWASFHGWLRENEFYCECGTQACVENMKEERMELNTYHCPCGNFWQYFHGASFSAQQTCEDCGVVVRRERETQLRNGYHFWLECRRCQVRWEDFSTDIEFGQRCFTAKCGSRGKVIGVVKRSWQKIRGRKVGGKGGNRNREDGNSSSHPSSHCDMCQRLIAKGNLLGCAPVTKVAVQWTEDHGYDVTVLK